MTPGQRLRSTADYVLPRARFAAVTPHLAPWSRTSLASLMMRRARRAPTSPALYFGDRCFDSRTLAGRSQQIAHFLASRGVEAGDVVAILMDNRPEYVFAMLGVNQLTGVGSLINTNLKERALLHALRICGARKLILGSEHLDKLSPIREELGEQLSDEDIHVVGDSEISGPESSIRGLECIDGELDDLPTHECPPTRRPRSKDTCFYIYTSGTTGLPKAAIIRNQRMLGASFLFGHMMHRAGPGDTIYVPLPLYHSSAVFSGLGASLVTGAAMALRRRFSTSAFWDDVRRYDASSFVYIGELCRYLLGAPEAENDRAHALRVGVGNGMPSDIWERFRTRFGIPVIREFYGSTEGNAFLLNPEGIPGRVGRLNRSQVLVRCDPETGELERDARGFCERIETGGTGLLLGRISPFLTFEGYLDRKATKKKVVEDVFAKGDRYFNSGDLLQLHPGRWVSFSDRVGDTFRWKGENVSTGEVAAALLEATGVEEANVYGVTVAHNDGRAGMAAIRTGPDFDLDAFAQRIESNLAGYQRPVFLRLLQEDMQVTGTLKHRKVDYRDEGYDLARVKDPLFVLQDGRYVPLGPSLLAEIEAGTRRLG